EGSFFFQAEDGIRDGHVTGVQTCALPISLARYEPEPLGTYRLGERLYSSALEFFGVLVNGEWERMPLPAAPLNRALAITRPIIRSEERRVGKESSSLT